jgi:hypothetical protein
VLIEISRDSCELFGFHRAEEMIEYGRKRFKASFPDEKKQETIKQN